MFRGAALAAVLLVASVALGADPLPEDPPIARDAAFVRDVDGAVAKGVAWLRRNQASSGSWMYGHATQALGYHTQRVCGVARDDESAVSAWTDVQSARRVHPTDVYTTSLLLIALSDHGDHVPSPREDRDVRLAAEDLYWADELARTLIDAQTKCGGWTYRTRVPVHEFNDDHSNTQYALLALKCAARCGVRVPAETWTRALTHLVAQQESTGPPTARRAADGASTPGGAKPNVPMDQARGWTYRDRSPASAAAATTGEPSAATASMTAGGVGSVVICRSELLGSKEFSKKLAADSERSVWDGLAWLGSTWRPSANLARSLDPRSPSEIDLYTLYGVERAGSLAGVARMAGLDWYEAGVRALLATQRKDGSWDGLVCGPDRFEDLGPLVGTCFALLFLRRGTVPVRLGAVTRSGGDADINFAGASKLSGQDLEDFLDLVLSRSAKTAEVDVRTRLLDGATSAGPKIVAPLLARLAATGADIRTAAFGLLRHATGLDFGFTPDGPDEARAAALVKWRAWWDASKDRLAYDAATKRLVVR